MGSLKQLLGTLESNIRKAAPMIFDSNMIESTHQKILDDSYKKIYQPESFESGKYPEIEAAVTFHLNKGEKALLLAHKNKIHRFKGLVIKKLSKLISYQNIYMYQLYVLYAQIEQVCRERGWLEDLDVEDVYMVTSDHMRRRVANEMQSFIKFTSEFNIRLYYSLDLVINITYVNDMNDSNTVRYNGIDSIDVKLVTRVDNYMHWYSFNNPITNVINMLTLPCFIIHNKKMDSFIVMYNVMPTNTTNDVSEWMNYQFIRLDKGANIPMRNLKFIRKMCAYDNNDDTSSCYHMINISSSIDTVESLIAELNYHLDTEVIAIPLLETVNGAINASGGMIDVIS